MVMRVGSSNERDPNWDLSRNLNEGAFEEEISGDYAVTSSDSHGSNRLGLWTLATILLLILSVAIFVTGMENSESGGARVVDEEQAALENAAAEAARPTSQEEADSVMRQLTGVVSDIEEQYRVKVGVSLRAGGGVVRAGEVNDARAWSSMSIPIAFAAAQKGLENGTVTSLADDISSALTPSDNDAALRLWEGLGTDDEAVDAVEAVLHQAGDPTNVQSSRNRKKFEGFDDIHWTLENQVIFASRMACLDGVDYVLPAMVGDLSLQRSGLGLLPYARFKDGGGPESKDSYLFREFGLVGDVGRQIPVAIAVVPDNGNDATAREAASALAEALAPVIASVADMGGQAECQVPAVTPSDTGAPTP